MKKKMLVVLSCIIMTFTGCQNEKELSRTDTYEKIRNYPVTSVGATYVLDVSNIDLVVEDADYVTVGRVEEYEDTIYKFPVQDPNTKENNYMPYTNYKVKILQNIKNELQEDTSLTIQKNGGVIKGKKELQLLEGDFMLEVGKEYIFVMYTQKDGTLLATGSFSTVELPQNKDEEKNMIEKYKTAASGFVSE